MGRAYSNTSTSFFLNPRVVKPCGILEDCRFNLDCYSATKLHRRFSLACVCNLDEKQILLAGKPLLRRQSAVQVTSITVKNFSRIYIQRAWTTPGLKTVAGRGALLLVLVRVSSLIDRLFQTGIVSEKLLDPSDAQLKRLRAKASFKFLDKLFSHEHNRNTYICGVQHER